MEKTFIYYDVNGKETNYTAQDKELKNAIIDEMFETYFTIEERLLFNIGQILAIKKALTKLTNDNDNWEQLLDDFGDELKEYFEQEAREYNKYNGEDL